MYICATREVLGGLRKIYPGPFLLCTVLWQEQRSDGMVQQHKVYSLESMFARALIHWLPTQNFELGNLL